MRDAIHLCLRATLACAALSIAGLTSAIAEVGIPLPGSEQQLNANAAGAQASPDVACRAGVGCISVWNSASTVAAQRFDADGAMLGTEFTVGSPAFGAPRTCMSASGEFAVTWSGDNIEARLYDAAAVAKTAEFQVSTYATAAQAFPSIACDDSSAVVAWTRYVAFSAQSRVYGQRLDSLGAAQGTEFFVPSVAVEVQTFPDVAMQPSGDFVVAWADGVVGAYMQRPRRILAREFDATGAPLGGDFVIGGPGPYATVRPPHVAAGADEGYVVAWSHFELEEAANHNVFARRLDPPTPAFQVNAYTTSVQGYLGVDVAMDEDGGFVIVWASDNPTHDLSDGSIRARWYDSAGAGGAEFQVNEYTTGEQFAPSVAMLGDRRARMAWDNDGAGGGTMEPRTSEALLCHGPGKSKLSMKRGTAPSKDQIKWKLSKSTGAVPESVGDPLATTTYDVTIRAGGQSLLSATLPPSSQWSVTSSGIRYEDDTAAVTPVTSATIKHGKNLDGRGGAQLKASGSGLGLPSLFITAPVSVIVSNSEHACWAATYAFPSRLTPDRYQATQ